MEKESSNPAVQGQTPRQNLESVPRPETSAVKPVSETTGKTEVTTGQVDAGKKAHIKASAPKGENPVTDANDFEKRILEATNSVFEAHGLGVPTEFYQFVRAMSINAAQGHYKLPRS